MRKVWRNNGLSIVLSILFVALLAGQAVAGFLDHNAEKIEHGQAAKTFTQYLASNHFWEAVFENWESEFLQMSFYVVLTVFLYQKGSAESKHPDKQEKVDQDPEDFKNSKDAPMPVRKGGWRLRVYKHSLSLSLFLLFALSFAGHALSGKAKYNEDRIEHRQKPLSAGEYFCSSRFWFESLQNWQSEFLAVLSIVVLSIWLREHGSPESKPVAAPHYETGE